jgi:hypothetical protein
MLSVFSASGHTFFLQKCVTRGPWPVARDPSLVNLHTVSPSQSPQDNTCAQVHESF